MASVCNSPPISLGFKNRASAVNVTFLDVDSKILMFCTPIKVGFSVTVQFRKEMSSVDKIMSFFITFFSDLLYLHQTKSKVL